jgi:hypothetical protein
MELRRQEHCRFGLGPDRLIINFVGRFNFSFLNYHLHQGLTNNEYPNFGNADRCNAVVARQENKAELFCASQDFSDRNIKIVSQQFVNPEDPGARRTSKPNFRNFNADKSSNCYSIIF